MKPEMTDVLALRGRISGLISQLGLFSSNNFLRAELIRGAIGTIGIKIANVLFNMTAAVLLARALSPNGYGMYTYALSITSLLAIPVQLGMPTLLVRQIAKYQHMAQWGLLRGILLRANQIVFFLSTVVIIAIALIIGVLNGRVDAVQSNTIFWAILLIPLMGFSNLREAALQGLRRVVLGQIPDAIIAPVAFVVLLLIALEFGRLTPPHAMVLYLLSISSALICGAYFLLRQIPEEVAVARSEFDSRSWWSSLIPLSFLGGLHVIHSQTDIFMLGLLATKEAVGLYRVAYSGAALVLFFMTAIGAVVAPNIARLHSEGDIERLQRMVVLGARASIFAAIPIALVLIVFGSNIIELVYGKSYVDAHSALGILCLGQLVNALTGFVHIILNMMGFERETLRGVLYSVGLNITLNFVLIPQYGANGAAISAAISIAAVNVYLFMRLYRMAGIWSLPIKIPVRKILSRKNDFNS
jgi:O-antigen/teichoic acid export membrane protein